MGPASTYRNESWLREHYIDKGLTIDELADQTGVSRTTIFRWVKRHGIEHRHPRFGEKPGQGASGPATYHDDGDGHMYWTCGVNDDKIAVHRLLAISEYGVDVVRGHDVHHKNGIPWDNRPSNIESLTKGEHSSIHAEENRVGDYDNEETLLDLYEGRSMSINEIADSYGVDYDTIRYWLVKHDIDRRPQHITNP